MPFGSRQVLVVHREVDEAAAEFVTSISLRNACVAFHDDRSSFHRPHIVVQSGLQGPLIMHGFSERALGYVRLLSARAAGQHELRALSMCQRAPLGLGVPLSHPSSIYHQLYHAVPSWLHLRSHGPDAPASAFIPLVLASASLGRGKPASPRRWHAWELSVRPLTRASAEDIATATMHRLRTPCTCFDRLEATAQPYNLGARTGRDALRRFRIASLRNALAASTALSTAAAQIADAATNPNSGDLLFVSRRGERRALTNEAAVWRAVRRFARLKRIIFEDMSLSAQMMLVSDASALIAVHGQALAWLAFLPWHERQTGLVEVSLVGRRGMINACYEHWSAALGVHYWRVAGQLTGGCSGGASSRDNEAQRAHKILACNVTVDVGAFVGAVSRAVEFTHGRGRRTR
jgi:hypothetical protein